MWGVGDKGGEMRQRPSAMDLGSLSFIGNRFLRVYSAQINLNFFFGGLSMASKMTPSPALMAEMEGFFCQMDQAYEDMFKMYYGMDLKDLEDVEEG